MLATVIVVVVCVTLLVGSLVAWLGHTFSSSGESRGVGRHGRTSYNRIRNDADESGEDYSQNPVGDLVLGIDAPVCEAPKRRRKLEIASHELGIKLF
ncbi:unnamed protein product [Amoebophrya sp. A25]|nr:unnamed protein product [Amoebophrya sp. A25]|eukprot:GSA25T00018183001.1